VRGGGDSQLSNLGSWWDGCADRGHS
jgi:hypothetical protein